MMLLISAVLFGAAAFLSSRLLTHYRIMTWLASALAFFEVFWLLATSLIRYIPARAEVVYMIVATICIVVAAVLYRLYKQPLRWQGSGWRDTAVLVSLVIVLGGAIPVMMNNGLEGTDFVLHGFYNGDVTTFTSLVQKALISPDSNFGNPFTGNGALEYPTLLHRGFGTAFTAVGLGLDWLHFWPLLVYIQIFITIPLFFLLWDTLTPETQLGERWLGVRQRSIILVTQVILTLSLLTLSWDNYIYPQSHFFLTSSFLLLGAILFSRHIPMYLQLGLGAITATVLLLSNAVTGSAAVIFLGVHVVATNLERRQSWRYQLTSLVALIFIGLVFLLATPGNAALGAPHFSYTAATDITRLIPWFGLLLIGLALQFSLYRRESLAILGVASLTGIVFVFSTRDIIVANSSRFIYHALLLGLPLMLRPVLRACWYLYREFILSTRRLPEYFIGAALPIIGLVFFLLPSLASVASAYDNLLFNNEQRISFQRREVLWWLAEKTPPSSIIIANPEAPWDIPLFTGRALLRAGDGAGAYWLSLDDEILQQLRAAFAGDVVEQKKVLELGDYLVLTADERTRWPVTSQPVLDTKAFQVFELR